MQRGHRLTHPSALEMPSGFDPSGIPCVGAVTARPGSTRRQRRSHGLPGLPPTARVAAVMEVIPQEIGDWLAWGCVDGRPVMFAVEAGAAAEMMASVTTGEIATAIIEPWQLVLERLD